jgi:hypothetical protein
MKIYLASYKETNNHGFGRKISVAESKPPELDIKFIYKDFVPSNEIINNYYLNKNKNQDLAAKAFELEFSKQLDEFKGKLLKFCENNNKEPKEVLPFKDGDTLLSWERFGYSNYRKPISNLLESLGYEVILK